MLGLSVDNGWTNLMQVPCHGGSAMLQLWVVLYNKLDVVLLSPEVPLVDTAPAFAKPLGQTL